MACRRHQNHPSRDDPAKGLLYCVDTQSTTKGDIEEQVAARLRELMKPKAKKLNEDRRYFAGFVQEVGSKEGSRES